MIPGTLVIWSLSRLDNGTRRPCPDGFDWSAGSSMNCQWYKTLEEIDYNTRWYWLLLLYKEHDLLVTCKLLFRCTCYCTWSFILLMYMYICYFAWDMLFFLWWHPTHIHVTLHIFCFLYSLQICTTPYHGYITYAHLYVHFYHVTTSMFTSITSPLDNIIYDVTWIRLETWHDDNWLGSDGSKRCHVYIFLLPTCLYISATSYMLIRWYQYHYYNIMY